LLSLAAATWNLPKIMMTTGRAALEQARETRRLDGDRYVAGVSLASEDWRAKAELDVASGFAPK
jgi:hypothetical protein